MSIIYCILFYTEGFSARPFITDDADPVDKGVFESEIGTDIILKMGAEPRGVENERSAYFITLKGETKPRENEYSTYFSLKHGLTEKLDIGFEFSYEYPGVSPLNIGFKMKLVEIEKRIEKRAEIIRSIVQKVSLSTGYSTGEGTFDFLLISATEIPPLSIFLNIGPTYNPENSKFDTLFLGFSPQFGVWRLNMGPDISAEYSVEDNDFTSEIFVGLAFTAAELEKFTATLDAGAGVGLDYGDIHITFGLTCDF
jgi:hypothetical protein